MDLGEFDILEPDSRAGYNKKWTVMVYMAADNDLEFFGVQDLNEMEFAGSTDDVNLLVQFDRHPNEGGGYTNTNGDWSDTRRFYIEHDEDANLFHDYTENENMWIMEEQNMGSADVFTDFLHWGLGNYSAEHYLLVMWDHGEGIFSGGRGGSSYNTQNQNGGTRGICEDATDGDWLNLWEMRKGLEEAKIAYSTKIDIISFDICWIGAFETAYELMPYADYYTASPEEEPNPGWDYKGPMKYLIENPTCTPEDLAIKITDEFKEQYKAERDRTWRYMTYFAMDLTRFQENMIPLLNDFADVLAKNISDNYNIIESARQKTETPHRKSYMLDLFHFVELIANSESAPENLIKSAEMLNDEYDKTILKFVHGSLYPNGRGPTIYFPYNDYENQYESNLLFSNERWDEFIELYLTPIQIDHIPNKDSESDSGEFEIKATIKGSKLDSTQIYLFFQTDKSESKSPISMKPTGEDFEFTANIKTQDYNTRIYYYIRTQTNTQSKDTIFSPQDIKLDDLTTWYSFYVGADLQPPLIVHDISYDIIGTLGEPFTFNVNITDNLGLDLESLYFNYYTNNNSTIVNQLLEPTKFQNQYSCEIPGQNSDSLVYYYFTASDQAQTKNSAREPQEDYFEFNVSRTKPKASFLMNKLQAFTYELVNFTSTSKPVELLDKYIWDFGDGTTVENQQNTTHSYTTPGVYTITLTVFDNSKLRDDISNTIIILNSPPVALIQTDPIRINDKQCTINDEGLIVDVVYEDDIIELNYTSSYDLDGFIQSCAWDFGDGNEYKEIRVDTDKDGKFNVLNDSVSINTDMSDKEQEERMTTNKDGLLTYIYPINGNYTIKFSVSDNVGASSEVFELHLLIQNQKPKPNPGYKIFDELTVMFSADKTGFGTIDSRSDWQTLNYTWNLGDGFISYEQNPNHTYAKKDKYKVTLIVRDDDNETTEVSFDVDLRDKKEDDLLFNIAFGALWGIIIFIIIIMFVFIRKQKRKDAEADAEPEDKSGTEFDKTKKPSTYITARSRQIRPSKPIRSIEPQKRITQKPYSRTNARTKSQISPQNIKKSTLVDSGEDSGNVKVKDLMAMIKK